MSTLPALPGLECPVIKYTPAEFLVRECLFVPLQESKAHSRFTYLELRKSGLTTFEAVAAVARHFDLATDRVLFAGLKDEDGITEQLIALDGQLSHAAINGFNAAHSQRSTASIMLRRYGEGDEPLRTGALTGNSFRLTIRNLSRDAADRLTALSRYEFHFLNYYDRQRFGMPNAPKTTHLIGQALVNGNYAAALTLLHAAGTPESLSAVDHAGSPESFFASLGGRVTSFYKSSHFSYIWNSRLRALVGDVCPTSSYEDSQDGIDFLFSRRHADVLAVLARRPAIEYTKSYVEGGPDDKGLRSTVVQAQVHSHGGEHDDAYPSRYRCDVSFFLPSGAYATMLVRQLVNVIDVAGSKASPLANGQAAL